eukprot:366534-Chlamydomonas_euryale.AAC.8
MIWTCRCRMLFVSTNCVWLGNVTQSSCILTNCLVCWLHHSPDHLPGEFRTHCLNTRSGSAQFVGRPQGHNHQPVILIPLLVFTTTLDVVHCRCAGLASRFPVAEACNNSICQTLSKEQHESISNIQGRTCFRALARTELTNVMFSNAHADVDVANLSRLWRDFVSHSKQPPP